MSFSHDRRGQSVVVGTVILFGFLILALASYQAFAVPAQNNAAEFEHSQNVQSDMQELRASLLDIRDASQDPYQRPVRVNIGFRYDSRLFAVNPPPPEGALTTRDLGPIDIRNARVSPGGGNFRNTDPLFDEEHDTRLLTLRPGYNEYRNPPRTTFEHSLLYNRFEGANQTITGQRTINGAADGEDQELFLVAYSGDINRQGLSTTLDPETVDGPTPTVPIGPDGGETTFQVELPTHSPAIWEELIEDEPNAEVIDTTESSVTIELEGEWDLKMARVGYDGSGEGDIFSSVESPRTGGGPRNTAFDVRWVEPVGSEESVTLDPGEHNGVVEVTSAETGEPVEGAEVDLSTTNLNVFGTTSSEPSESEPADTQTTLDNMDGDGSESNPYQITNDQELQAMEADLEGNYEIANNIDISGSGGWFGGDGFDPVGDNDDPFVGTLDGNGFEIDGFTVDRGDKEYVGLFGKTKDPAMITNVHLRNVDVTGEDRVGSLVGYNSDAGVIERSSVVSGTVSGESYVGGLVGRSKDEDPVIRESFADVEVTGTGEHIGGLVGRNHGDGLVIDSYARGSVTGGNEVGGLVGRQSSEGTIQTSYSTGEVSGGSEVGGLVGEDEETIQSYWDTESSGTTDSDGGDPLTTSQMQGDAAGDNMDGFDFVDTWETVDGDYPELRNVDAPPAQSLAADGGFAGPVFASGASMQLGPLGTPQQASVDTFLPDGTTNENGRYEFTFSITDDPVFAGESAEVLASAGDGADRIEVIVGEEEEAPAGNVDLQDAISENDEEFDVTTDDFQSLNQGFVIVENQGSGESTDFTAGDGETISISAGEVGGLAEGDEITATLFDEEGGTILDDDTTVVSTGDPEPVTPSFIENQQTAESGDGPNVDDVTFEFEINDPDDQGFQVEFEVENDDEDVTPVGPLTNPTSPQTVDEDDGPALPTNLQGAGSIEVRIVLFDSDGNEVERCEGTINNPNEEITLC